MFRKTTIYTIAGLLLSASAALAYLMVRKPALRPAPVLRVTATAATVERGRYLFEHVLDCDGCHSERDFSRFGGPVIEGRRGVGVTFPPEMGLPGRISAPNLTSDSETGLGGWSDGEILRAIREGVSRDGRALFPMMPYAGYRNLSDEDAHSLIAYLRTLPAVHNVLPETQLSFPVNVRIKSAPAPVDSVGAPPSDPVKYGEYLTLVGGCRECHTKEKRGQLVEELAFGGGREFKIGSAMVVSANITPDTQTGLGKLTESQFLEKFYQYKDYAKHGSPKVGDDGFTLMPWLGFSQMEERDLKAIYAYLRTVKPVVQAVETHPGKP